jgi:hypothetical protein
MYTDGAGRALNRNVGNYPFSTKVEKLPGQKNWIKHQSGRAFDLKVDHFPFKTKVEKPRRQKWQPH